jgi:hypothetical protein
VSHVARRNHRLDLPTQNLLQSRDQIDLELVRIFEDLRVEQDLVGFAEAEVELVLVEEFFVGLALFVSSEPADACIAAAYLGPLELHGGVWGKKFAARKSVV